MPRLTTAICAGFKAIVTLCREVLTRKRIYSVIEINNSVDFRARDQTWRHYLWRGGYPDPQFNKIQGDYVAL